MFGVGPVEAVVLIFAASAVLILVGRLLRGLLRMGRH